MNTRNMNYKREETSKNLCAMNRGETIGCIYKFSVKECRSKLSVNKQRAYVIYIGFSFVRKFWQYPQKGFSREGINGDRIGGSDGKACVLFDMQAFLF